MLLQALSNFLAGPEGSIVHLAHEPLTGKNLFLQQIIENILQIEPKMRFFYCDSNTNLFKRLIADYNTQIFLSKVKDSPSLAKILTPMMTSSIFTHQIVIIDCLSDLFRNNRGDSFGEYRLATESFALDILNQINLIAIKNHVHFILIHQTSYRPQMDRQLPVEQELMNIAKGIWVTLSKTMIGNNDNQPMYHYNAHLSYEYQNQCKEKDFPYILTPQFQLVPVTPKLIVEGEDD